MKIWWTGSVTRGIPKVLNHSTRQIINTELDKGHVCFINQHHTLYVTELEETCVNLSSSMARLARLADTPDQS